MDKLIAISEKEYRDKVYACWMGKNIGGTLGVPFECRKWVNCLDFYPVLPEEAAANDDLDLQLVWLKMLEDVGLDPALADFAKYWQKCAAPYPWNEYGFCNRNLARGLKPPISGCFENHFIDEMGSPIRSEIWACLAPADPQLAAVMAWKDSSVDHAGGEGTYGEMFWAAVQAAAFVVSDPLTLIGIGLEMIPIHCRISRVIREAVWCKQNNKSWAEARQGILEAFGQEQNPCHAVQNHGFTILGWLYGRDFGEKLCIAVNCAYDTDCTGATLGATMGIIGGTKGIPAKWSKPIGDKIVLHKFTRVPDAPKTIGELTERTVRLGRKFNQSKSNMVNFHPGKTVRPKDLVSLLRRNELAIQALRQDPMSAVERRKGIDIWFHYNGEPALTPGIFKTVGVCLEQAGRPVEVDIRLSGPSGWKIENRPDALGQKRFGIYALKAADRNEIIVQAKTKSGVLEASFTMLGPGEAKGYPVNTQAGNCPKCGGWIGDCLCRRPGNNVRERILFLGNSITSHPPKADIDWLNDCGMAASALEKDYVHVLLKSLSEITGKKSEMMAENIADFERNYATYDLNNTLKKCFEFKAGLVIVAIGENVPSLISEKSKMKFKASMVRLLTALKKNNNPTILVRSCFWPDKTKDEIMKQACAKVGGVYVDISELSKDESNYARAERTFAHDGVGGHPGDKGMEAIANALFDAIKKIK